MDAFAADFARSCGYAGDSLALLEAFGTIRRSGIAHARQDHVRRKAVIARVETVASAVPGRDWPGALGGRGH